MKRSILIPTIKQIANTGLIVQATFVFRPLIIILFLLLPGIRAFAHPGSGIVVDKNGNVYFTDTGMGIWKIDTQGKLIYVPASRFHWMAIDEKGYFAGAQKSFGEWFERVTPQNTKPVLMMCSDFPLTVTGDGNLYYADTRSSTPKIMRRTPTGIESVVASADFFEYTSGIAAGPDGSLFTTTASHSSTNSIRKITHDGKVSIFVNDFVGKAAIGVQPPPETLVTHCRGLFVDSTGNVYVAATGSRRVLKITPQGKVNTILQTEGSWSPTGVTVFKGEVYVLEWHDTAPSQTEERKAWIPRVRKIGHNGKVSILATVTR